MIRAVVQNGGIQPLEPLPPDWHDGREVVVGDLADRSADLRAPESFLDRAQRLDHAGHGDAALVRHSIGHSAGVPRPLVTTSFQSAGAPPVENPDPR
jgi:hypothetical protein